MAKPGDFLLSIIDFLGILLPGAVLLFVHGNYFLKVSKIQMPSDDQPAFWIVFFVGSYIVGHFLLGFGTPLNRLQAFYSAEDKDKYYQEVKSEISLPPNLKKNRENSYNRAFSFVRLYNAAAVAEVDRHTAEYKLFRSLTLVFVLDLPLASLQDMQNRYRVLVVSVLAALTLFRFLFKVDWAQRLTFEYYHLMTKGPRPIAMD